MRKAMQKRELDRVAIQSAMFDSFHCKKGMRFSTHVYLQIYICFRVHVSERIY